ncbi:Cell wall hydrolase/autolysin [Bacillus thuringiensis serovar pakistani str. T13001]|nr:Cell wall hydrolase/autolysin [Bacillus thuringiensis serovar pakistani str. T13001]
MLIIENEKRALWIDKLKMLKALGHEVYEHTDEVGSTQA